MARYLIIQSIDPEARGNALAALGVVELPDGVPVTPLRPLLLDKDHARGLRALLDEVNGVPTEGANAAQQASAVRPAPRFRGGLPVTRGS